MTAIALAISGPSFAQVNETNFIQQVRADTEADRQAVMSDNMGLTEEEAKAF